MWSHRLGRCVHFALFGLLLRGLPGPHYIYDDDDTDDDADDDDNDDNDANADDGKVTDRLLNIVCRQHPGRSLQTEIFFALRPCL